MSLLTLPGLIDPHVHLRDPGQTQKEDFYTGTAAALAGGYTTVIDMPNNLIPITTLERLEDKITIAKQQVVCDVGFYFGSMGDNLEEFEKVVNVYSSNEVRSSNKTGSSRFARTIKDKVFGLKLYLNETTGNFLIDPDMLETIFSAWDSEQPILLHAEDNAVEDVIKLVKQTRRRAHFCHISTAAGLKQIIQAKEENLPITCGVTPHHLFLTEEDAKRLGPYGMMKPPLGSKSDVDFLWKNLKYIDVVESDHAPHTKEEKQGAKKVYGVPGLETTLPLLLTAVSEKRLSIDDVVRLCHTNPAKIFNVPIDESTEIEVDLGEKWVVKGEELQTKCKWSPFEDWSLKGKVKRVIMRGKVVFENGEVTGQVGSGSVVFPNLS